jgi:hypothetical protein
MIVKASRMIPSVIMVYTVMGENYAMLQQGARTVATPVHCPLCVMKPVTGVWIVWVPWTVMMG